jgi:hypothetical protein
MRLHSMACVYSQKKFNRGKFTINTSNNLRILKVKAPSTNDCRQREIQNHGNHLLEEYGNSFTFNGHFESHCWRHFDCPKPLNNSSLLLVKPRSGALRSSSSSVQLEITISAVIWVHYNAPFRYK